jgi:Mrp family chromosome partitioning ATPase
MKADELAQALAKEAAALGLRVSAADADGSKAQISSWRAHGPVDESLSGTSRA